MSGLRVLFVAGDPTLARRLEADLRACVGGVSPETVLTPESLHAALKNRRWDAIVVAADAPEDARRAALDAAPSARVPVLLGSSDSIARSLRRVRRILDERTAELSRTRGELLAREEQLRHAQKMEVIGNFAGGIAHDFNNIVMSIAGYASMMLKDWPADQRGREDLAEIMRAAEQAQALTRQLLGFARKEIPQPKHLSLADVIRDVEQLLRRSAGEGVELSLRIQPDVARVRSDPNQLQQVLLNLVLNARDAMPAGGTIRIEVDDVVLEQPLNGDSQHVPAGRWVRLIVSDTGSGMDPITRRRALEPFFTTKPAGSGTGLGLAIVHDILARAGAQLRLLSAPGEGTTFEIFFPPATRRVVPRASVASNDRRTVLLVEEDATLASLVTRLLEREGYQVLAVPSAEQAIDVARGHSGSIDLLLTDVVLPGRDGRQLVQDLAAVRAGVPALYMSAHGDDVIERAGVDMGRARILDKPFRPEDLYEAVRDAIAADAPSV